MLTLMLSSMSRMKLRNNLRKRVVRIDLLKEPVVEVKSDTSLSTLIKNDLLYGVGSRPSLPSCFEDEDELKQKGVDPLSDMRHDSWHDASVAMNPELTRTEQIIEVGSQVETTTTEDTLKDE